MFHKRIKWTVLVVATIVAVVAMPLMTGGVQAEAAEKRFAGKSIRIMSWSDESGSNLL